MEELSNDELWGMHSRLAENPAELAVYRLPKSIVDPHAFFSDRILLSDCETLKDTLLIASPIVTAHPPATGHTFKNYKGESVTVIGCIGQLTFVASYRDKPVAQSTWASDHFEKVSWALMDLLAARLRCKSSVTELRRLQREVMTGKENKWS
jgi:hypothetical protein